MTANAVPQLPAPMIAIRGMEFSETCESRTQIVESERPLWMPGNLDAVPGTEVGKDLTLGFFDLFLDYSDLFFETDVQ